MTTAVKSAMNFCGYQVTELQYNFPMSNRSVLEGAPDFTMNFVKSVTQTDDKTRFIALKVNLWVGQSIEDAQIRMVAEITGEFKAEPTFTPILEKNAVAILFPYLRALVSSISTNSTGSIVLPLVNVAAMFDEVEASTTNE